mgnify:CR=1 FL=1
MFSPLSVTAGVQAREPDPPVPDAVTDSRLSGLVPVGIARRIGQYVPPKGVGTGSRSVTVPGGA